MSKLSYALVTGGSRGIGRAICVELAKAGHGVLINYRSQEKAALETLSLVEQAGSEGEIVQFDVADRPSCNSKLAELLTRYPDMAILVNNAGVAADGLFPMLSAQSWDQVISTTLHGFYNVSSPIVKAMIKKRLGNIVNISSISGLTGNRGQVNYSAAKAGLIGATRSLAAEVARLGIRVNAVAPGLIETDMTAKLPLDQIKQLIPQNRLGKPEEVAKVVRFLCSDDASYITGQVISVNGGMF